MLINGRIGKLFHNDLEEESVFIFADTLNWIVAPSYPFPPIVNENLVQGFKGNYVLYVNALYSEGLVVLSQEEWDELIHGWNEGSSTIVKHLLVDKLSLYRDIPLSKNLFDYINISIPNLKRDNKITSPLFVTINGNKKLFPKNIIKAIFRIMYEERWLWIENLLGIELSGNLALEFFKSNKEFLPPLEESIQLVQLARAYCAGSISKEKMDLISNHLITID